MDKLSASKSILVVEDDDAIRDVISTILENEGYMVNLNKGGLIFNELETFVPDLILLDILLTEISGKDLCMKLKHHPELNKIPVIIMSTNNSLKTIAEKCHANDYLPKPFDIDTLVFKVTSLID